MRSYIRGVGYFLPERVVTSEEVEERLDLVRRFGLDRGWIRRVTGVMARRWADAEEAPSRLAISAGQKALDDASIAASEVDTVIFCGITRDFIEPATANVVAESLRATNARVFDITNACNGIIDGIDVADSFIRSGRAKRALVTTGEKASISINKSPRDFDDFMLAVAGLVISDGGGAVVVEETQDPTRGIIEREFRSDPSKWRLATGGRFRRSDDVCPTCGSLVDMPFVCEGREVLKTGIEMMLPAVASVLRQTGWEYQDVEVVFCHEASKRFVETGSDAMGDNPANLSPRFWSTVEAYGNTSTFSLPLQMSQAKQAGALRDGTKTILIAGGAGFSVAAMTVIW